MSFAQFEREIISERIRDKIAAQRRKGKWSGGRPVLGYDVDRSGPSPKLVVNSAEAVRVREIFALYLQHGSLLPVVKELREQSWVTKAWHSQRGHAYGSQPFDKCSLHALLTNPLYAGMIRHKEAVYAGEHEALVDEMTWSAVQSRLSQNGRNGGVEVRNSHGALLKGLLHCKACQRAMVHTFTEKKGRCYRYYTCTRAIKDGYDQCAAPSLPAAEIERVVIDQIREITTDKRLQAEVLQHIERSATEGRNSYAAERRQTEAELRRCEAEIRRLSTRPAKRKDVDRLVELHEQVQFVADRLRELREADVGATVFDLAEIAALFADFDAVWAQLTPREQSELVGLLVARVEYDGDGGQVAVSLHETGIQSLNQKKGAA